MSMEQTRKQAEQRDVDGNSLIATGLGVGAVGALGALVAGAVCPLCVVATPALLGVGLVQKWRERRHAAARSAASLEAGGPGGGAIRLEADRQQHLSAATSFPGSS